MTPFVEEGVAASGMGPRGVPFLFRLLDDVWWVNLYIAATGQNVHLNVNVPGYTSGCRVRGEGAGPQDQDQDQD